MKASVLGLLIAALAFGASTIYLAGQLQAERALADELLEQTRILNSRVAEMEKSRAERRFAGGNPFTVIPVAPGDMAMKPPPPKASSADAPEGVEAVAFDSPPRSEAFVKMMRSQTRARNKKIYADVGAALGLNKEETTKLIDLLTDQQLEGFEPGQAASAEELVRLAEEKRRTDKAEIADLIGAVKAQSLEEYQQSIPLRHEVEMISQQIEGSAASLNDEQRTRLLAVLIEERARMPAPEYTDPAAGQDFQKAYAEWQSDYYERVSAEVLGILNSEQLTAFNDFRQWQKEMLEHAATLRPAYVPQGSARSGVTTLSTVTDGSITFVEPARPAQKPRKAQ
jgi:hypothetical protein